MTEIVQPGLSVVIVSYNVRERLRQTLESLRGIEAGSPTIEVIVVDNASSDETIPVLKPLFPEVLFLAMDRNLGFSIGCNRGASRASGQWILFLNPDTVVMPGTLREMMDFVEKRPELGIAGCRILDGDGNLQLACRRSIPTPEVAFWRLTGLSFLFPGSHRLNRYNLTYLDPNGSYPVEAVSGSFLLIRMETFREVMGFDEIFFLYGEDLDLCLRVANAGWQIWYHGSTHILHHKGQSAATRPWGARMNFYQAMVTFARKNFGVGPVLALGLSVLAGSLAITGHIGQTFHRWRRIGMDILLVNFFFFLVSAIWMWQVEKAFYLQPGTVGWYWHLIMTAWFLASLGIAREYTTPPASRQAFWTGLGGALGGFFATGFLAKTLVFSRASFLMGGGLAALAIAARHSWSTRLGQGEVKRVVLVGTGAASIDLAKKLHGQPRWRVLGHLSVSLEPAWVPGEVVPVASLPNPTPALRAMDVSTLIVPGGDSTAMEMLARIADLKNFKVLLAVSAPAGRPPVFVDITLDHTFPVERPE